ncbi:MAG: capsular biosynthesis protein [Candidatus Adiutrix sp.]|jgi:capsular polysaccharide export protein|nr:capsular biosynthesis protein [Candidatus Adiutrix sp.]
MELKNSPADRQRVFLFLQMPQSRFAVQLRQKLMAAGHQVYKINFCGGDVFHWGQPGGHNFTGGINDWPAWFSAFLDRRPPTDLLMIGDRRPLHQVAALLARLRGVRVWVFDEGYMRPHFITMEENGVNGYSSFPRDPETILTLARDLPEVAPPPNLPPDVYQKVKDVVKHHIGNLALLPLFRRYQTHRPSSAVRESLGLASRYLSRKKRRRRDEAALKEFLSGGRKYFFVPLQLAADTQIRHYSKFLGIKDFIAAILASFKRSAPPDWSLVVRSHPLDWLIRQHRRFTLNYARAIGLSDRVCYVDEGNTNSMIVGSGGLALINSTTGANALLMGKPVFCLGQAIYGIPGLATSGGEAGLDAFWSAPTEPRPELCDAFIRLLQARAVLPGNFYTAEGIAMALEGCLNRLGV